MATLNPSPTSAASSGAGSGAGAGSGVRVATDHPRAVVADSRLSVEHHVFHSVRSIAEGTGVTETTFWNTLADAVGQFRPENRDLLATRDKLQAKIDEWHQAHPGADFDPTAYAAFLRHISYIVPEPEDAAVETANVDPEVGEVAAPQLVVPVDNARYAHLCGGITSELLHDTMLVRVWLPCCGTPGTLSTR